MKRYIAVLLFLSALVGNNSYADNVLLSDAKDITFKTENGEELVYDKDGNLYSGAVVLPDSENRKVTYFYQNGKKHGIAFSRFVSGNIEIETSYMNGKKNGEELLFYPNNNPQYKRSYKDDVIDGEEIIFYQNGKPQKKSYYKNGILDGEVNYFNEKGEITKIETYKDGIKDGMERIIANNTLREENVYRNGKLNGTTKKYDEKYLTDEIQYVNDKREGIHKTYGENGTWREIPYKNDIKEGEGKIFYPNKTIAESITYVNDKRNGLYQKFAPDGKLTFAENYKDDKKDGISRVFNDKGELLSVSYYIDDIGLTTVDVNKRQDIRTIQDAYFSGQLSKYSNKRNLWYKILWLGLNLNQPEILEILEKDMKMYAVDIDDMRIYQRYSGGQFESETSQLFFGLSPLDYAINVNAPIEIMQKFISQINEKNHRGYTPLRDAVRLNKIDEVKFLILKGADLTERDKEGNDILLYAIVTEAPYEMIDNIIKSGADVNTKNNAEQTPIMIALAQKNTDLLKLLIKSGANTQNVSEGLSLLYYAYNKKAPSEIMEILLANGADVNSTDNEGNNLLLRALKDNDEMTAMFALNNGADINQKDNEGETPLSFVLQNKVAPQIMDAVFKKEYDYTNKLGKSDKVLWQILMEQNQLEKLKEVWDKMPDIATVPDATKKIPLSVALEVIDNPELHNLAMTYVKKADDEMIWNALKNKNFNLFKVLLTKDADINAKSTDGDTLLIYMIKNNYGREYLDLIKSDKLIIDATDANNRTALDIALADNDLETAEYLLESGAKPERSTTGTSYMINAKPSQAETIKLLLKYSDNISESPSEKEPLLMTVVKNLNLPLFEKLAQQESADFNIKDDNGNSLLLNSSEYFAVKNEKDDINLLKDNFLAISKILLDKGLDINARNGNGETLLIKLAKYCGDEYDELAKFLIDNGADIEPKDQYNKKADDYRREKL